MTASCCRWPALTHGVRLGTDAPPAAPSGTDHSYFVFNVSPCMPCCTGSRCWPSWSQGARAPRGLLALRSLSLPPSRGSGRPLFPSPFAASLPGQAIFSPPILLLLPSVKLRMSSVILNEQCASEKKMPARCLINETWNLRGRPRILSKRRGKGGRTSATKAKRPQNIVLLAQAGCFAPKKCFLGGCKSSRKRNVMESLIFLRFGCDEAVHTLGTG